MIEYNITKEEKSLHIAEKRTTESINRYEFEKFENGWYVKKYLFNVSEGFPSVSEMYIPQEVVEQILLVEAAKDELVE